MQKLKYSSPCILVLLLVLGLAGCDSLSSDASYSDADREKLYKNGSLLSDKGGADLLNLGGDEKSQDNSGIGVNGFLWRASLDTISFMPIVSADPFGGVIITDWYSAPDNPNERVKLNILIRDRELRADGIKVSVFRQMRSGNGWMDTAVAPTTAGSLENAILTKARQIRLAQKEFK